MKTCRVCKKQKDELQFYLCKRKGGNPKARHTECKQCAITRVKANHDPVKARRAHLRRKYDISLEEYEQLLLLQGGKCAVCPATEAGGKHNVFCVDHDHVTGKIRELLCMDCNIVLGIIKDSPEHLGRLASYIIKHNYEPK